MNTTISNPETDMGGQEQTTSPEAPLKVDEILRRDVKFGTSPTAKVFKGMPFKASAWSTTVAEDGTGRPKPIEPKYIKDFQDGRIEEGLISLSIEIRIRLVMGLSFKHASYEAPLAVSNMVHEGTFMVDRDEDGEIIRIIINEAEAEAMACDADGDRASLIWNADRTKALFLKWPFTKRMLVLDYVRGICVEKFHDLTPTTLSWYWNELAPPNRYGRDIPTAPDPKVCTYLTDEAGTRYVAHSEKAAFLKNHRANRTGPLTVLFNTMDAFECVGLPYRQALLAIGESLDTGLRYEWIEEKNMKAKSKQAGDSEDIDPDKFRLRLQRPLSPFLTGRKAITRSGQKLGKVQWTFNYNTAKREFVAIDAAKRAWGLKLTKYDFKERADINLAPEEHKQVLVDKTLISRVLESGYLRVDVYPHLAHFHNRIDCKGKSCEHEHTWPKFPYNPSNGLDPDTLPVISVMLVNRKGQPLALTDTKRDDYDAMEGIDTYQYLLPPVWDCELNSYVHPITHLAKYFQTWAFINEDGKWECSSPFDSAIRRPDGTISAFFASQMIGFSSRATTYYADSPKLDEDGIPLYRKGEKVDHFRQYPVKAVKFQQALTEYCGQYGFAVPSTRAGLNIKPKPWALGTVQKSVTVDYGRECNEHEMWEYIQKADAVCRLSVSGNKQDERRVRHYYLGYPNGCAIVGSPHDNIRRPGQSISQRVRAATPKIKFTVAVTWGETMTQAYMTPTGVKKQLAECFMKQPLTTELEYQRYCKTHGIEVTEPSMQPARVTTTITGARRKSWLVAARPTARIGKLVDDHGMKIVSRPIGQVKAISKKHGVPDIPIDLVIPLHEFHAKGCMRSLLGLNEVPLSKLKVIHIPGPTPDQDQIVQAILVELEFFRTGSASENIPGRYRMFSADGMDGHIALEGMMRLNPNYERKDPDTQYAEELIRVGRHVQRVFPQFAPKPKRSNQD